MQDLMQEERSYKADHPCDICFLCRLIYMMRKVLLQGHPTSFFWKYIAALRELTDWHQWRVRIANDKKGKFVLPYVVLVVIWHKRIYRNVFSLLKTLRVIEYFLFLITENSFDTNFGNQLDMLKIANKTTIERNAWFPYDRPDRPDRPSRLKKCSDDRDDHMETLPRRSQTTRTTETTSIAWIELSSMRTIGTIV